MDSSLSRSEKEKKIVELREALARLETELQRDMEREQHEAIDHLDEHFRAVETKLENLKTFWLLLKDDWRKSS